MPAKSTNNLKKSLTTSSGASANYHDMGAGEISPLRALSPGLVFDSRTEDYLYFLCYYGYKNEIIKSLAGIKKFSCPPNPSADLMSELNYPSISIARLEGGYGGVRTVHRTMTNVGPSNCTYMAQVDAPKGLGVKVKPESLLFTRRGLKVSYQVTFDGKGAGKGYKYGSLTWSDGAHSIRTVFVVNVI